jgi:hypothetical protein
VPERHALSLANALTEELLAVAVSPKIQIGLRQRLYVLCEDPFDELILRIST